MNDAPPASILVPLFSAYDSEDHDQRLELVVTLGTGVLWVGTQEELQGAPETRAKVRPQALTPDPAIGLGNYLHFKGGKYRALFLARYFSRPEKAAVVYTSLIYGTTWVRPATMWVEETDRWPDGVKRPRFVPESAEILKLLSL